MPLCIYFTIEQLYVDCRKALIWKDLDYIFIGRHRFPAEGEKTRKIELHYWSDRAGEGFHSRLTDRPETVGCWRPAMRL